MRLDFYCGCWNICPISIYFFSWILPVDDEHAQLTPYLRSAKWRRPLGWLSLLAFALGYVRVSLIAFVASANHLFTFAIWTSWWKTTHEQFFRTSHWWYEPNLKWNSWIWLFWTYLSLFYFGFLFRLNMVQRLRMYNKSILCFFLFLKCMLCNQCGAQSL